jgi:hypothetical protein
MREVDRKVTPEIVLEYAADLRRLAARANNPDPNNHLHRPFATSWSPSETYARYLIRKVGPAKALLSLEYRAEANQKALDREEEERQWKEAKERKRRNRERKDAEELAEASPGARIDAALVALQLTSAGSTSNLDGEIRSSSEPSSGVVPFHRGEEYSRALGLAVHLARKLERSLERVRRSPVPPPKIANRDEQLRALVAFSPEQIALMYSEQGLPRQIRERREALGLDPETGDEAK